MATKKTTEEPEFRSADITAVAQLESTSPYSQSFHHDTPRLDGESADDYEHRTWRNKCHSDDTGHIMIPQMSLKMCLDEAVKYIGMKIPGKRGQTWTKNFLRSVLVVRPIILPITVADVREEWFYCHADGKRTSGTRVMRCFPCVPHWKATVEFIVLDASITKDVFESHLYEAGRLCGIGRFRPGVGGFYGRFKINKFDWIRQD